MPIINWVIQQYIVNYTYVVMRRWLPTTAVAALLLGFVENAIHFEVGNKYLGILSIYRVSVWWFF